MRRIKVIAPCWPLRLEIRISQTPISGTAVRYALILLDLKQAGPFLREPFKTIEVSGFGQVTFLIPVQPALRFAFPCRKSTPKS
jgi:hypothetical protein